MREMPKSAALDPEVSASSHPVPARATRLGELLLAQDLITNEQLRTALDRQRSESPRRKLGAILVEFGYVDPADMLRAMADEVGTPFLRLTPDMIQPDAFESLPVEFISQHNLVPISLNNGQLTVAIEQFTDLYLLEEVARLAKLPLIVVAAEGQNIRDARRSFLDASLADGSHSSENATNGIGYLLGEFERDSTLTNSDDIEDDEASLISAASQSPTVRLVNHIIHEAVDARASDIHVEPDETSIRIRYRVDGDLYESMRPHLRLLPAVVSRIKIMAGMDISERRLPQDGGVTLTVADRPIDIRVSTMTTRFGEKAVMRIVDREAGVLSLEAIGLSDAMLRQFRGVLREPNGIVLVTGPTGSGKTSTLYAALTELISDTVNISTVEDPVERRLRGTSQFQVHAEAGFTFSSALRSLLRQDPDVIMVGEIRDTETARLAIEAALTGHLVLSTLHTNDAPTAVPRLVNMGVEPYLVAASLRCVLAQRLVRRVCARCRRQTPITAEIRHSLAQMCGGECPIHEYSTGSGCARCRDSGYFGRIGVFELLILSESMLALASDSSAARERHMDARTRGFSTLLEDGLEKVKNGSISVDGLLEIVSRTNEPSCSTAQVPPHPELDSE